MKNIIKNKNIKKWSYRILVIIFVFTFVLSLYKIIMYKLDGNKTSDLMDTINNEVVINETETTDDTEESIDYNNPYWKYTKMNIIDVDLTSLKKTNDETVGWIQVDGTNISYPFVQSSDNKFYLTHTFNKSYNGNGWVYMDARNDINDLNERNTILYAHAMLNKTMFGTLSNIFTKEWRSNKDSYYIKISTEKENTVWKVFSTYKTEATTDYIQTSFSSDEEFQNFVQTLKDKSNYDFNIDVTNTKRILTLSTCITNNKRRVVHAILIKSETK